jgi:hypothetical protein
MEFRTLESPGQKIPWNPGRYSLRDEKFHGIPDAGVSRGCISKCRFLRAGLPERHNFHNRRSLTCGRSISVTSA